MRQVLLNNKGALVARMPRPMANTGQVLVRVRYSLISTGTEIASLRAYCVSTIQEELVPSVPRVALRYLGKAIRDPRKAARRLALSTHGIMVRSLIRRPAVAQPLIKDGDLRWTRCAATEFTACDAALELTTDMSKFGYQAMSQAIPVAPGMAPLVEIEGKVEGGAVSIGLLDEARSRWIGSRNFDTGHFQDRLIFDPEKSASVTLVVANAGSEKSARLRLNAVRVLTVPLTEGDLPLSELDQQGWNVGYSAAGEVVALGAGITDIAVGDIVACAGAGMANHADYVTVPRNLVCRVPTGCDLLVAATTTVGTIALQGVRRATPQLGETVCVLGLGLVGQITAQLLRANGVRVIGLDPSSSRVSRAIELGMSDGTSDPEHLKALVRDFTGACGVDRVLITAATESDAVINLAMEIARPKGVVVIVGDIGLNVKRDAFYRKELDLLMSTSYGPGRYDREYEDNARDYPYPYVRWTLNRNMQAYMELAATQRIQIARLIERVIPVEQASAVYRELATSAEAIPLAVLLSYPDETRSLPEPPEATGIALRGHRKPPKGVIRYALVGAGAFGTAMLVPQMAKRKDRFFLRGIVSRHTTTASNFARANQVEVLATDLDAVLQAPEFDLIVIATRHHEHADQVIRALRAGKHVFVEKPLALSWDELERVAAAYEALPEKPVVMVGFNRRFSPAMQALKQALEGRRGPLMVSYRLNGGYIPLHSWVQGSQGGGRNIGEACHMYDCFRFLAGSPVTSIEATSIDPGSLPYLRSDNFVATLRYEDGSVANLVYTAVGPKDGLAKERVEVFCDGEAYVLDDYSSLVRARDGQALWQGETDKGHFEELSRLGDVIVAGGPAPIGWSEILETSAVALRIEELLIGKTTNQES